jgi:hypothetical protein
MAASGSHSGDLPLARTLQLFAQRLRQQARRQVDLEVTAHLLQQVRHHPLQAGSQGQLMRHDEAFARITPELRDRWVHDALGIDPQHWQETKNAVTQAGRIAPASGTLFQLALYGVIPVVSLQTTPVTALGATMAALVAQPFITAALQTRISAAIFLMREKAAPLVQLPSNLKANTTLPELQDRMAHLVLQAEAESQAMQRVIDDLCAQHQVVRPQGDAADEAAAWQPLLQRLEPEQRDHLEACVLRQTQRAQETAVLIQDALRIEGLQDRQRRGQIAQMPWRTMRGMSGIFSPALQAANAARGVISATSVVTAVGTMAAQHLAAGRDERRGMLDELSLAMLYGDLLNAQGETDWKAGRPITAEGVDEDKLRALVGEPETVIAGRIRKLTEAYVETLKGELDGRHGPGPDDDLEAGHLDQRHQDLRTEIARCESDLRKLGDADLDQLAPEGMVKRMLDEVMHDPAAAFAWREGAARQTVTEYSAQLGERLARQFTYGVGGGAGALALGRGTSAAVGGTSNMSAGLQVALHLGSGALALFNAVTGYASTNVKNARRDRAEGDPGLAWQVLRSLEAPTWQWRATNAGAQARESGRRALVMDWRDSAALRQALAAQAGEDASHHAP